MIQTFGRHVYDGAPNINGRDGETMRESRKKSRNYINKIPIKLIMCIDERIKYPATRMQISAARQFLFKISKIKKKIVREYFVREYPRTGRRANYWAIIKLFFFCTPIINEAANN